MLISIVPELDIALESIRLSAEVVATLPPIIETFFNKIKEYRKISTRYDKLTEVFAAFVCLAASLIGLR